MKSRLARRLSLLDAVLIGLSSMVGAGIFVVATPAANTHASLIWALGLAALIAAMNAISMMQLAALFPESGGAYVYGRRRLGNYWGFLAGWGFVIAKTASCAAMALTFAHYAVGTHASIVAAGAVLVLTAVNSFGIEKTSRVNRLILILVLTGLGLSVGLIMLGGDLNFARLRDDLSLMQEGALGRAAGMIFFAFAGYARIATLGEEVINPRQNIPLAMKISLVTAFLIYSLVFVALIVGSPSSHWASSPTPLAAAITAGPFAQWSWIVRGAASCASLGVLLSLLAGVSRTVFAMSVNGDLPAFLGKVDPLRKVPQRAEWLIGLTVMLTVLIADLSEAIGFSAFAILIYYTIANVAAWTLKDSERQWPKVLSLFGMILCLFVACQLPWQASLSGIFILGLGSIGYLIRQKIFSRMTQ